MNLNKRKNGGGIMYITYEEPHIGEIFTFKEMKKVYEKEVDHEEYTTFDDWLHDMLRSGIFMIFVKYTI